MKLPVFCIFLFVVIPLFAATSKQIPESAKQTIARVHDAAAKKNLMKLRQLMVEDFIWSFGGDASAEQAISEWKKQPRYLRELARATKSKCVYRTDDYIQCPANAGVSFRAGFRVVNGHWKMAAFVEGD